jgi:hypothetical protein
MVDRLGGAMAGFCQGDWNRSAAGDFSQHPPA